VNKLQQTRIEEQTSIGYVSISAQLVRGKWEIFATGTWAYRWTHHELNYKAETAKEIMPPSTPIEIRQILFDVLHKFGVDKLIDNNRKALRLGLQEGLREEQKYITATRALLHTAVDDAGLQAVMDAVDEKAQERL
jgi:hypothetical protein